MKLKIILTTILTMTTLLNYAQDNGLVADGWVQPVSYTINGTDRTDWIERMDVIKREDGSVECRVRFKDNGNTEYWNFQTKSNNQSGQIVSGTLHAISMESNDWAYIDDKAYGTFTSDRDTGVETLDFYFHIHQSDEIHNVISWKAFATAMGQEQKTHLSEEWHYATNDNIKGLVNITYDFKQSGEYNFHLFEEIDSYSEVAVGTYHYQPETNEIFIHIEEKQFSAIVGIWAPKRDYQEYFKILELTDTTVVVSSVAEGKVRWTVDKDGMYLLNNPHDLIMEKQTYQRIKRDELNEN